jgi:hypothetical protein
MIAVHIRTGFARRAVVLLAFIALLAILQPAQAAIINYGNFNAGAVTFGNVTESSGTDPVPLYGPPSPFPTGLDFDPATFVSTASGGASDVTDGQLNFSITGTGGQVAINSLSLFENGDFTLAGTGTAATQALAGAIIRVTVTEINGLPVAPLVLAPSNASVGFNLVANPGVVQPWSLGTSINIASQLAPGSRATRVEVAIDNQLLSFSQTGSLAFIAKKDFNVQAATTIIPEPATLSLLVLPFLATRRVRRAG